MAVLSDSARAAVWADLMRLPRTETGAWAVTKTDLRAAVNAADDWTDANLSSFTAAIPEPVRGSSMAHTLPGNVAAIARGGTVGDVSEGVADRSQSGVLLAAYNDASAWMTTNATGAITAALTAAPNLTNAQALLILEHVCRARAGV